LFAFPPLEKGGKGQCCSFKPFVLSLSKHERLNDAPFDKLRVNGDSLTEQYWGKGGFKCLENPPMSPFAKGGSFILNLKIVIEKWKQYNAPLNKLTFTMCHCEPFAFCYSERSEESHYFAQDKLREGRYDPRRFAPRNDYFSGSFTIDAPQLCCGVLYQNMPFNPPALLGG